ncbi:MAG: tetratricopeptide repeat protein, partial [Polyangiales bacterium]
YDGPQLVEVYDSYGRPYPNYAVEPRPGRGRFGDLVTASAVWLTDEATCPDARAKIELLLHVARWYRELRRPAYAIDCLEQASAMAIYDVRPRLALAQVYQAEGRIDDAIAVLDEAYARAPHRTERKEACLALAAVHEKARGDATTAYAHYARARGLDADDLKALRGIARIAPTISAWSDLGDVLDRLLELAEGDDERASALMQAAEAREVHFLDPEGAAARLEQVLELHPHDDGAYVALARCYRKLRLWDAAVHVHERHVEATTDDRARIDAYAALARLCESELGVLDRAVEAHRCVLDLDPEHLPSLEALARLHERRGESDLALSTWMRVAEVTTDARQKVDIFCRLAVAHEERLGDRAAARGLYRAALDQDPEHLPALAALRRIASDLGEHEEHAWLLDREQRHTKAPRARAKLLVELALLRRDQLDDARGAMHAFEEAHDCDPDHEGAMLAIAEACVERGEMARAEPLLTRLVRDAGKKGRLEKNRLHAMYGHALAASGKPKRAIEAYRKALEAISTDAASLRGLAEATWIVGDFRAAIVAHQKLLTMLGDDEGPLRAQTFY